MKDDAERALKEIKEYDGKRLSLCVAKKKTQGQKKPGLYKTVSPSYVAMTSQNYAHENLWISVRLAPPAAPKGNEEKSRGFRKNKLKARLIIRNLSFQVYLNIGL